jgi:energy-coupling factor transporter ATP-binding protein EcfA2
MPLSKQDQRELQIWREYRRKFQKAMDSDDADALGKFLEEHIKRADEDNAREAERRFAADRARREREDRKLAKARERQKRYRDKKKKRTVSYDNVFYVSVRVMIEVIRLHHNRKSKVTSSKVVEEYEDTFFFRIKSTKRPTKDDIKKLVKARIAKMPTEYVYYKLKAILKTTFIRESDMKNQSENWHPNQVYMFRAHVNFSWIPDVKFEQDGRCVYQALGHLLRAPRVFKKPDELLQIFQQYANEDAEREMAPPQVLTLDSGVKADWLQRLCETYDVTHYCLDFDYTVALKHISMSQNYNPLCYIRHDEHMYLITDKKFVNKISMSRKNLQATQLVGMLREEKEVEAISQQILEDVPVEKLPELNDTVVIYNLNNLEDLLLELRAREDTIYVNRSRNNKVVRIDYKNDVTLLTDPHHSLGLLNSDGTKMTWKTMKDLCEKYNTPFVNQSFPSFVFSRVNDILKPKRVRLSKEMKKAIKARQENKCNECDRDLDATQYDHIVPIAAGGSPTDEANIQALCKGCHFAKTKDEQEHGTYYSLPHHASTFNRAGKHVITSAEFNRFAFIERLENPPRDKKTFYLDEEKTRRNILLHMAEMGCKIPVFTVMDKPEVYVHQEDVLDLKPGSYFVQSKNHFPLRRNGWYSHFMVSFCLKNNIIVPGDIMYQFTASLALPDNYFTKAINDLMTLPGTLAKYGPNLYVGLLNRINNTVNKTFYTSSFGEASYEFFKRNNANLQIEKDKHDFYKITTSETLVNDYNTAIIYHLILDIEAIELYKMKKIIESHNGRVSFLNTDCCEFWYDTINNDSPITQPIDISEFFWDNAKTIPKYKYEVKDKRPEYERKPGWDINTVYQLPEYNWTIHPEPESNDFIPTANTIIESGKSMNILGIAGSGKTTLITTITNLLDERELNYAVLAPTNKACRVISKEATTIHKFIASSFFNTKALKQKLKHLDYIIVDELSMVPEIFYAVFLTMKRVKPALKFIACGDYRQLGVVNDRAEFDYKNSEALRELCDGQRVDMTKCRRSDKRLFELSLNVDNIDPAEFPKVNHPVALCYTNEVRRHINEIWMNRPRPGRQAKSRVLKKLEWDDNSQDVVLYKDLPIIARVNSRDLDIANNETFTVESVRNDTVVISDGEATKDVPINRFQRLFFPAYAVTCHKSQGQSINRPYTIYEWEKFSPNMKYVAITRATKLELVNIA